MAISFNNSNLSSPVYSVYNVNEFDGVDYTTTPTNVAETRAVDMSNYLPEGQGIVKRKGLENVEINVEQPTYDSGDIQPYTSRDEVKVVKLYKFNGLYVRFLNIKEYGSNDYMMMIESEFRSHWETLIMPKYQVDNTYYYFALNAKNISLYEIDNKLFFLIDSEKPVYGYIGYEMYEYFGTGVSYPRLYIKLLTDVNVVYTSDPSNIYAPTIATQVPYEVANNEEYSNSRIDTFEPINLLSDEVITKATFVATRDNCSTWENGVITWDLTFDFSNFGDFSYINYRYDKDSTINFDFNPERNEWHTLLNNKTVISFDISESSMTDDDYVTFTFAFRLRLATKPTLFDDFSRFSVYDDKLWFYGSKSHKNIDLHTDNAVYATDRHFDYTYIPDTSYQTFGSSASKIIGYGTLTNGNQMVIKEFYQNEPNVFIRTKNTATSTNEYGMPEVKITYPITQSGVSMNMKGYDNVIQFGNYALINAPKGIYTINIGTSTATQTYEMIEMSYFIRNDLGDDLTGSWYIVKDNFLYLSRLNKDNKRRVYVADVNRMSLVEGHYQFEWWVLDNMNYDSVDMIDDELVFNNEYGSFKFSEDFIDKIVHEDYLTFVNDDVNTSKFISTEMQYTGKTNLIVDRNRNDNKLIILNSDSVIYTQIKLNNDYAYIKDFYANFRKNFKITPMYYIPIGYALDENNSLLQFILNNNNFSSQVMTNNNYYYYLNDSEHKLVSIKPNKLYCYVNGHYYDYDDCVLEGEKWFYLNGMVELGNIDEVIFNAFDIKLCFEGYEENVCDLDSLSSLPLEIHQNEEVYLIKDFFEYIDNTTQNNNKIVFEYLEPVKSYWYSKHNCLGDISTLKTMTNMYFVPEVRHGGETYVGYRTCKRENQYFTNAKGESFDFNDIDFDDFTFGEREFGRTYSSKKKIKNFSFIQLKIYSNDKYDSSASMLSFKYRYSKNNKGVK